jgi:hypothetical protein
MLHGSKLGKWEENIWRCLELRMFKKVSVFARDVA